MVLMYLPSGTKGLPLCLYKRHYWDAVVAESAEPDGYNVWWLEVDAGQSVE